jgi:hypothetical protein
MWIDCDEWDAESGVPTQSGFSLNCHAEEEELDNWTNDENDNRTYREVRHRYFQSDWQPVRDNVWAWIKQQEKLLKAEPE